MVGGQNDAGWLFAKVMDGSLPVMEIKVFAGVFGEVLMKVFVRAARGPGRALLPRTSWTCLGSFSAPRKGLNGPRRG
jgi:hypothetical protein